MVQDDQEILVGLYHPYARLYLVVRLSLGDLQKHRIIFFCTRNGDDLYLQVLGLRLVLADREDR